MLAKNQEGGGQHGNGEGLIPESVPNFWNRVIKTESCWNWVGPNLRGYGRVCFRGKSWITHRLSWVMHNGPIPEGKVVMHSCDNPSCVNPNHLSIGTQADNLLDMRRKGRGKYQISPISALHRSVILEAIVAGYTQASIAKYFSVNDSTITRIKQIALGKDEPKDIKRCTVCGEEKPLDEFPRYFYIRKSARKSAGDGHLNQCAKCKSKQAKASYYARTTPEQRKEYSRNYRETYRRKH